MQLNIRLLRAEDIEPIEAAFTAIGWNKPAAQYARYLSEQEKGLRVVLAAFADTRFCGYINVVWKPDYPLFREAGIPELQDFNVLPNFRRQGIGTRLMEAAERIVSERSEQAGIGVGMTKDYGAAQRLYVQRGYVPDGEGLVSENRFLNYGDQVRVDDALVLHFIKRLR